MDNIFVGERLARLRKLKGRTQADVATQFGISKQAVSKWENGISMPDVLILPDLANYFGVDISYFYDKNIDEKKKEEVIKGSSAIRIINLSKSYEDNGVNVIDDLNLDIYDNISTAIMGPSGCGKTTLLNCISGLEQITQGSVEIFGTDISKMREPKLTEFRRENTSYIFQQYNLVDSLNVVENIKLPYKVAKQKIDRNRLKDLIKKLGLSGKEKSMPSKLSGGQQQRVAVARALLGKNKLIFADEPTGALDLKTGNEVLSLLLMGCKEFGMPVVIITHDSKVAANCDIVHFMLDGKVVKTLERPGVDEVSKVMVRLTEDE